MLCAVDVLHDSTCSTMFAGKEHLLKKMLTYASNNILYIKLQNDRHHPVYFQKK